MIEYKTTTNKDFSTQEQEPEIPIIGYQPRFRPKQQETEQVETPQETEPVSQEKPQGVEIDFSNTTNLGMRHAASKYLQQKLGLTKEQAAGLVGVWQAESGFNINAENKEEKAGKNTAVKSNQYGIGIGQWTGSRHDDFARYVAEHGGVADLKTQLDFAIDEIQNKYSDYLNNLRKAQTAKDATAYTYAQYTGANERNISSLDDLYARVSKIEAKYAKKHKEMYGKSGSGNLDRRVRAAEESIFAKKGAKLPKFQAGKDFKVSLDYKDYYEKPDDYQTVKINTIGKYDYRPSEETVDQKVLPQNFRVESPYVLTEESFNEDRSNRDKALTNSYFTKSRGKREKREQINDIKNAIIEGSQNYIIQNSYPYIADYINSNGSEGSIKLSAKNTDISKFLEGRTIDKAVLDRVKEVAKERNVDPYDLLAHMLIEGDRDLETGSRYNTHDVIRRQLGNRFGPVEKMDLDTFKTHIGLDPNKKYKQEVVQKQVDKFMNAFNDKLNNIIVPKDPVDAVAVRITTAGRDFNPAQKGWTNPETGKTVKNSYIDMIDSAIGSLKKAYPSFDDTNK